MISFVIGLLVVVLFLCIIFLIVKLGARLLGVPLSPEVTQIVGLILLLVLIIYVVSAFSGSAPWGHWRLSP